MDELALSIAFWGQVAIAAVFGGVVGLERQLRGKPMGVRTGMLICIATALFVLFGTRLAASHGDPSRVIGQVVVGIGFLGAGVIFNRGNTVQGLTSASLIWLLGALGSAAGLERLEYHVPALRRGAHAPGKFDSRNRPQV